MASYPDYQFQQSPAPVYFDPSQQPFQRQPYVQGQAWQQPPPFHPQNGVDPSRRMARTPSPTPSERAELEKTGFFDWKKLTTFKRENLMLYIVLGVVTLILVLFAILHNTIIKHLQPAAEWVHNLKYGWLIPIGILFVMSFPPLFGAEFIAVLCGLVWGQGIGFAIVAVGQFLGELANFFTFKYCCQSRSEKMKKSNITYACLGKVVEDGGVKVAIIARYSIIPSHATTALFATCGMKLWVFVISALVSLPKNFVNVYIGARFETDSQGVTTNTSKLINGIVLAVTVVVTIVAMRFITAQINAVKPGIIYQRRKARQFALPADGFTNQSESSTIGLNSDPPRPDPKGRYPPGTYNV